MKAMILAAGLGTRLRPLTIDRPKALVEIQGHTLLEIILRRLRAAGVQDVIVNVHHFADMVVDCLRVNSNFGMHVEISHEEILLDTGGGLKRAAYFFADLAGKDEPFIVHNVDVLSTIDLREMLQFHNRTKALATLAVQKRHTSRYLLFDENAELCGRRTGADGPPEMARPAEHTETLAFTGIHVISPAMLPMLGDEEVFPIITTYLRLAAQGERILAFRADQYYWRDLGRRESIEEAEKDIEAGKYSID